tara:strand:- start:499 stop:1431 length:933 start_codon:yes stop_codon:yes gene_type:complete
MNLLKSGLFATLLIFQFSIFAQNTAEQLGYPADSKLLIIHADDAGVSHSENAATIKSIETGYVNSSSIMVPCPWFPEIAEYAKRNKEKTDFGLHLTVTSEWKNYKWGPVTSKDSVSGLVNERGYLYSAVDSVIQSASPEEVEREIRNQVEKAYQFGIDVTHLDAHMGGVMSTPEFLEAYVKVGREYELPVLLSNEIPHLQQVGDKMNFTEKEVIVDYMYQANPEYYKNGMAKFYTDMLNNLQPGLSCLLIHIAYSNEEMRAVTIDHPSWGAEWRQADFDFFTSDACKKLLSDNNIQLVTWKEIRDKIVRK